MTKQKKHFLWLLVVLVLLLLLILIFRDQIAAAIWDIFRPIGPGPDALPPDPINQIP